MELQNLEQLEPGLWATKKLSVQKNSLFTWITSTIYAFYTFSILHAHPLLHSVILYKKITLYSVIVSIETCVTTQTNAQE